ALSVAVDALALGRVAHEPKFVHPVRPDAADLAEDVDAVEGGEIARAGQWHVRGAEHELPVGVLLVAELERLPVVLEDPRKRYLARLLEALARLHARCLQALAPRLAVRQDDHLLVGEKAARLRMEAQTFEHRLDGGTP